METRSVSLLAGVAALAAVSCVASLGMTAGAATPRTSGSAHLTGSASGSPTLAGCEITGKAKFKPGLTTTAKKISYTFTGKLSSCTGTNTKITSGKITATGKSPSLGCSNGNSTGTATVRWNNGKKSTITYSTYGVGNADALTGTVKKGAMKGESVYGALVFTATVTDCTTKAGITSATFTGAGGIG